MTPRGRPEEPIEIDVVLHDLKNLLTVIAGHSQLMLARLKQRDPLWRNAEAIRRAAESGTEMMLAALAPAAAPARDTDVDVNALVTAAVRMLDGSVGEHVEVSLRLGPGRTHVHGVARDLEQVVVNLVVNARDAMPQGGRLVLETGVLVVPDTWGRRPSDPPPGAWVTIAVSDTGSGMEPRIRSRLFEPYFTTKPTGTGLGLSTAQDIVRRHGGVITVASMVGCGSRFTVFLPWRAEEAMTQGATAPTPRPARETVLVVEDEPELRELVSEVLQLQGYTVLEARSAEDGLAVAEHHAGRIDLVITDVFMPGMAPRPFVEALRRTRPDAKVMYVSGHSDDEIVRRAGEEVEGVLLRKPFSIGTLATKVREVLDRP